MSALAGKWTSIDGALDYLLIYHRWEDTDARTVLIDIVEALKHDGVPIQMDPTFEGPRFKTFQAQYLTVRNTIDMLATVCGCRVTWHVDDEGVVRMRGNPKSALP